MPNLDVIQTAKTTLDSGGVIIYPTESVLGLGCDARNKQAVMRILDIKNRTIDKGLIAIAADFDTLTPWVDVGQFDPAPIIAQTTPCNWVVPISLDAPSWITGAHQGIAVRITTHPIARAICQSINYPLVSTSANLTGKPPIGCTADAQAQMGSLVDLVVPGEAGGLPPCPVVDAITGEFYR